MEGRERKWRRVNEEKRTVRNIKSQRREERKGNKEVMLEKETDDDKWKERRKRERGGKRRQMGREKTREGKGKRSKRR